MKKKEKIFGWSASAINIFVAIWMSLDKNASLKIIFILWLVANIFWIIYSLEIKSSALLSTQLVYFAVDFLGIFHYWVLPKGF